MRTTRHATMVRLSRTTTGMCVSVCYCTEACMCVMMMCIFRYTSSPLPSSPNQTTCPYECFSGYSGPQCLPCDIGICESIGIRRSPCDVTRRNPNHNGSCSLSCTPIPNAVFTGGAAYDDNCPFQCVSAGFYTPLGTRACLACNQSRYPL